MAMLMGTMLHEVFDQVMQSTPPIVTEDELIPIVNNVAQNHLEDLFFLNESIPSTVGKMNEYVPMLMQWTRAVFSTTAPGAAKVVLDRTGSAEHGDVGLHIDRVLAIEETVWSPRYGIRGQVDATVSVTLHRKGRAEPPVTVPLELKSGKSSLAHRAQVILYTLMMSDRYAQDINLGLLLYLKTGEFSGVQVTREDIRHLLIARNELAFFLQPDSQILPPMIQDAFTCSRCDHIKSCVLLHKAVEKGNEQSSGLGERFTLLTQHLTPEHEEYFDEWNQMISLEHNTSKSQKDAWAMPAWEREGKRLCFSHMRLAGIVSEAGPPFVYAFERHPSHPHHARVVGENPVDSFLDWKVNVGDMAVLSSNDGQIIGIATGIFQDLAANRVHFSTIQPLQYLPDGEDGERGRQTCPRLTLSSIEPACRGAVFRLDRDQVQFGARSIRSSVARLLSTSTDEVVAARRRVIVDLEAPSFEKLQPRVQRDLDDIAARSLLNTSQLRAISTVVAAKDYALILGMPGTGKTSTIAHLVNFLAKRGESVLIAAYTHSAVDNILLKLQMFPDTPFVRLGRSEKVHPDMRPRLLENLVADDGDMAQLAALFESIKIMAVTCLGWSHPLVQRKAFDYCIVDEASQITQAVCLGPVQQARVFVLVGDHFQLPPLVAQPDARALGMDVSLFKRLCEAHPQAVVTLDYQYRMHADIMALCNILSYSHRLKCGSATVAETLLHLPTAHNVVALLPDWLRAAVDPARPVVFLDTDPMNIREEDDPLRNIAEANIVRHVTQAFLAAGVHEKDLGIISPYLAQLKIIRNALNIGDNEETPLEISTVDKYQGRDKDCIVLSFVRANAERSIGELLSDWRRVNVALTRAKHKMVLVGSRVTLQSGYHFKALFDHMDKCGWIVHLPINALEQCGLVDFLNAPRK